MTKKEKVWLTASKWKLAFFVSLIFMAGSVHAAGVGGMSKFTDLMKTTMDWLQGVGLVVATGGFVLAGLRYVTGDQDAKQWAKSAFIGCALIAGAAVLVGFIKGFF